jgi:hypothetical protein
LVGTLSAFGYTPELKAEDRFMRTRATISLALLALAISGCGGGGGGSGGGSTAAASVTGTPAPQPAPQPDSPPLLTVTAPARGAYLDSTTNPGGQLVVSGRVVSLGTPVVEVRVNGQPATFAPNGTFQATLTLAKGANEILIIARKANGLEARSVRSVLFADRYEPGANPIPNALGARITEGALNAVAPMIAQAIQQQGLIDQLLLNNGQPIWGDYNTLPSWLGGGCYIGINVQITAVSYGTPQMQFDCTPAGEIVATLAIPNFHCDGAASDGCGIPWPTVTGAISATEVDATITVVPTVDPVTGQISVAGTYANIAMQGYNFDFTNLPGQLLNVMSLGTIGGAVRGPVEDAVANALKQDLPPRIAAELNGFFSPVSRTFAGQTITFGLTPASLAVDDDGITFAAAASLTGPQVTGIPTVPGSYFDATAGAQLPLYPLQSPNLSASLVSNAWNRMLFTSWQAGFWNIRVDQALLSQVGLNGAFKLDTDTLKLFMPGLAQVIPPGVNAPLAIDTEPLCQPVLLFTPGGPTRGLVQAGELHLHVSANTGQGFIPLFEFAVHAEMQVDFTVVNGGTELALVLGAAPRFDAEVLTSAVPPGGIDWGRAVSQLVPGALTAVAASVQPIPIPALGLSSPLGLSNPSVQLDGPQNEYLTVEGDL